MSCAQPSRSKRKLDFYNFLNFKLQNTSRSGKFTKIPSGRQLLGRQGACRPSTWRQGACRPSTWRQGARCKITTGKIRKLGGRGTCRQLIGRQGACRQVLGRQAPQAPYK